YLLYIKLFYVTDLITYTDVKIYSMMTQLQKSIIFTSFVIITALLSMFLVTLWDIAFAQPQQFTTYKSEKYGIQFQYPVDWTIKEKTYRFDEGGGDITVRSPNLLTMFGIEYKDALSYFRTLDIKDAAKTMISILEASLFGFDVLTIEESNLVTIDNKTAATAVIAAEERYYNPPFKFVDQQWIVIIGSNAYLISYLDSPIDDFDSPSHTMIRDHFIKSIKFLGDDSAAPVTTAKTIQISSSHFD
ncbi:MAG TPA: PsbP-related protein, partial [Nitrososphaeraceae archaeon]